MGVIINNPAFIVCYIALMLTSVVANVAITYIAIRMHDDKREQEQRYKDKCDQVEQAAARIDELIRERDALKKQQADADGLVERLAVMMAAQGTKKPDEVA